MTRQRALPSSAREPCLCGSRSLGQSRTVKQWRDSSPYCFKKCPEKNALQGGAIKFRPVKALVWAISAELPLIADRGETNALTRPSSQSTIIETVLVGQQSLPEPESTQQGVSSRDCTTSWYQVGSVVSWKLKLVSGNKLSMLLLHTQHWKKAKSLGRRHATGDGMPSKSCLCGRKCMGCSSRRRQCSYCSIGIRVFL